MLGPPPNVPETFSTILALRNEPVGDKWWSVWSHIGFAVLAILGAWFGQPFTVVIALIVLFPSEAYHICISFGVCMGQTPIQLWTIDRYTAPLSIYLLFYYFITRHDLDVIPSDVLQLDQETQTRLRDLNSYDSEMLDHDNDGSLGAQFNPPWYYLSWLQLWFGFAFAVSAIVTFTWPQGDMFPSLVTVILGILGWLIYALLRNERDVPVGTDRYMIAPTHLNWPLFILGLVFGALGIVFYLIPETTTSIGHSFWHVFASVALNVFLIERKKHPLSPLYVAEITWIRSPVG